MTGQVHWLPLAFVMLAAVPILYFWFQSRSQDRKYLVEEGSVRCRARGNQLVHCTVVRDAETGQPLGIRNCSAVFGEVRCDRACLPLFARRPKGVDLTA